MATRVRLPKPVIVDLSFSFCSGESRRQALKAASASGTRRRSFIGRSVQSRSAQSRVVAHPTGRYLSRSSLRLLVAGWVALEIPAGRRLIPPRRIGCHVGSAIIRGMPPLGAKERAKLPDSAFAYIDSRGQRRLPINDESHVRNALSRFARVDFEDDAARDKARTKLLRAAKKYGIVPIGFVSAELRPQRKLPSGLVTLLMADVEGSTELLRRLETVTRRSWHSSAACSARPSSVRADVRSMRGATSSSRRSSKRRWRSRPRCRSNAVSARSPGRTASTFGSASESTTGAPS